MSTLIIKNLSKTYSNGTQALKKVNLTINTGMYGLLGPNGAGKSTLMRTIATLQEADEGSVFFDNLDVLKEKHEVRKILGFLPQEFDVYPKSTPVELLDHLAILKGIINSRIRRETIAYLLERTNLSHVKNKHLGGFSGGMKQRFGIAQALLGNPKIIIVDEPTAGLDPEERFRCLNILAELGENIIVILSTHIVEDVTEMCNNMAIINLGETLIEDNPEVVLNKLKGKIWKKVIDKNEVETFSQKYNVLSTVMYMGNIQTHVYSENEPDISGFTAVEPNLRDAYFYFIRHNRTDGVSPSTVAAISDRHLNGETPSVQNGETPSVH